MMYITRNTNRGNFLMSDVLFFEGVAVKTNVNLANCLGVQQEVQGILSKHPLHNANGKRITVDDLEIIVTLKN